MNELRIKLAKLLEHLANEAQSASRTTLLDRYLAHASASETTSTRSAPARFMTQSITDRRVAAAFLLDRRLALHTGKPGWKIFGITLLN